MLTNFRLHPRLAADTINLGRLSLSRVLLMNDCHYPWIILVPQRANVNEIYQLRNDEQTILQQESAAIGKALMSHFKGDKLNIAALGNIVPQLHLHHIVRFSDDAAWPKPVWGEVSTKPYTNKTLQKQSQELKTLFSAELGDYTPC